MLKDKIKKLIENNIKSRDSKKTIENLIVFLVLLVVTVISINIIWGTDDKKVDENPKEEGDYAVLAQEIDEGNNYQIAEYNLERELEDILSKISGVGRVQVLITYSETSSVIAMHNEVKSISKTEESDSSGGTRVIESTDENKQILVNSDNKPITEKIVMPKIEGAIIIADGRGQCFNKIQYYTSNISHYRTSNP